MVGIRGFWTNQRISQFVKNIQFRSIKFGYMNESQFVRNTSVICLKQTHSNFKNMDLMIWKEWNTGFD